MQLFPCFPNNKHSPFVTPFFGHLTGALTPRHSLYQISFLLPLRDDGKALVTDSTWAGILVWLTTSPWSALWPSTCPAPGWCSSFALMPVFCSGANFSRWALWTLVVECWSGWKSHSPALHSFWYMQLATRWLRRGQPAELLSFIEFHDIWNRWAEWEGYL